MLTSFIRVVLEVLSVSHEDIFTLGRIVVLFYPFFSSAELLTSFARVVFEVLSLSYTFFSREFVNQQWVIPNSPIQTTSTTKAPLLPDDPFEAPDAPPPQVPEPTTTEAPRPDEPFPTPDAAPVPVPEATTSTDDQTPPPPPDAAPIPYPDAAQIPAPDHDAAPIPAPDAAPIPAPDHDAAPIPVPNLITPPSEMDPVFDQDDLFDLDNDDVEDIPLPPKRTPAPAPSPSTPNPIPVASHDRIKENAATFIMRYEYFVHFFSKTSVFKD